MEGHSPDIMTLEAALEGTPALIQTMLVRAPVVRALNGFDAGFQQFEDQEFWIRLMAAGYRVKHLRTPLVQVRRGTHQSLTTHWWSYHSSRLKVIEKHWRLYNEVLGAGGARRTASKQIRRAGIGRGGVFGRVVYAAGCIFGNELRPLVGLAATGRLSDVPYSRNGDAIAGA
jgi:GT2 family glycosyltransferase